MITVFQWFFNRKTLIQICHQSAVFMLTRHRALTISTAKKRLVSRGVPRPQTAQNVCIALLAAEAV